ncbi:MAG: DUF2834 domain-containing protein [Paracoccaceae bacterium]|nr:DUF2834 domain-containing protein [Paracoccaceae bacterium]
MSALHWIFLGLTVVGSVLPMWHLILWINLNGLDVSALWHAVFINSATTGLMFDLTISAITLTVWIISETYVRKNWVALWAIPATFLVGVSCGLPLFLFLRTRPII